MPLPQVPTKQLPANAIWGQTPNKVYADPAYMVGGRYGPRGDTYLDPKMEQPPIPPSPLDGLRAAAEASLAKPNIFQAPDPGDPDLIPVEPEAAPAGPAPVPGLSWRWGSKGAPSASQLADQRASFLATGQSPEIGMMADAARGRELVDENLRNRPDLLEARNALAGLKSREAMTPEGKAAERARLIQEQDADLASKGLWRAKTKAKLAMEEPKAEAEAFVDPGIAHARWIKAMEPINIARSPEAQQLAQQEQGWKESLAGIRAAGDALQYGADPDLFLSLGRNRVGGGAPAPTGGYAEGKGAAPAEAPLPQAVPASVVQEFAKAQGIMFYQAQAEFEKRGIKVVPDR